MAATNHRLNPRPRVSADYDSTADVLYVALEPLRPAEGEDGSMGIVYRYAIDNDAPTGVTVIGYRANHWDVGINTHLLATNIGDFLHIHPAEIEKLIEQETGPPRSPD